MSVPRRSARPAPSGTSAFDERLSVPWWWWPLALGVVGLIVFEVHIGHPAVPGWLPAVVLTPPVVLALHRLGRSRVGLQEDRTGEQTLRVGAARLPTRFVVEAAAISAGEKQTVLGPNLDPAAYVVHRPWIGPMVQLTLSDPQDPTPYWVFSVRRPGPLLQRLRTGGSRRDV